MPEMGKCRYWRRVSDNDNRTWQSTESLLGHELKPDTAIRKRKGSFSPASGFALLVASTSDEVTLELKSRISLCFPCQSRIQTVQKHKILLPLATKIPASHPFFSSNPEYHCKKRPNPASRQTYWIPSISGWNDLLLSFPTGVFSLPLAALFYFFARCFLRCALTNWTPGRGYPPPESSPSNTSAAFLLISK